MARVLLVDDDAVSRMTSGLILRRAGHLVVEAADGEAALDVLRDKSPDLVICDDQMPGLSGREVCALMNADVPFVLITGTVIRAADLGPVDSVITKPVSSNDLVSLVDRLCTSLDERSRPRADVAVDSQPLA